MNALTRLHQTDDQGFPLNPNCCPACKQKSQRMNDRLVSQMFGRFIGQYGHDERVEREEAERDYERGKFNG